MNNNLSIEELKFKNELLKNKTEKLKLTRNIVAVVSIVISLIGFLFGFNIVNEKSDSNNGQTNTEINSQNNNEATTGNLNNNNAINESEKNDSQLIEDSSDNDDDDLE